MALTQSEISRRFYLNRKHGGLCPRCGKKLERDGHYCTDCLEKDREYRSKSREFFRENHICSSCGKQIVFGSDKTCPECREKRARIKKNITEDAKEKERERQKSIYKDRKERGVCTRCGKRPPAPGRAKCGICLEKNAEEHRKKNYNRKNIKEYRIENRLCYYCGDPVDTDKKICSKCLQKCKEYGEKSGGGNEYWEKDNKLIFIKK